MSLDFSLTEVKRVEVASRNITHNLAPMAKECGLYECLWHPEECPWLHTAQDLVPILRAGLVKLKQNPDHYTQFDAKNGWGVYEDFVRFVKEVLEDCKRFPNAEVSACR